MEENWAEWRNELKTGLDTLAEKLGKLISHSELRSVPPYLEPITLSSTKQTLKRRQYTFAYLLVSQETLAALGTSLINLQMGTMLVQMQAGQGLVQIPLVAEECRYWVDGLKGSWDAVVYYTMQEAPAVTPLGSSTTSPLIAELTGVGTSDSNPLIAELTGSLAPLPTFSESLIYDVATTIPAGSSYGPADPSTGALGYRQVGGGLNGATGTSLNYRLVWLAYMPNGEGVINQSVGGANGGPDDSLTMGGFLTEQTGIRVDNLNTTDSMTFSYLDVIYE